MRQPWTAGATILASLSLATGVFAQERVHGKEGLEALARYLVKAKLQGYASGDERRIQHLADGGQEVRSEEDGFVYQDRWYGGDRFSGEELVWHQGRPLWSMNFYGATLPGRPVPGGFPAFHKAALRRATVDAPLRGPAFYREGDFVYVNTWTGSLEEFSGVERVFFGDTEIFRLSYHGGTLGN
jgi:hypothetical protein